MALPLPYVIADLQPTTENVAAMRERFENVLGLDSGRGADFYFDTLITKDGQPYEVWGFLNTEWAMLFRWQS